MPTDVVSSFLFFLFFFYMASSMTLNVVLIIACQAIEVDADTRV